MVLHAARLVEHEVVIAAVSAYIPSRWEDTPPPVFPPLTGQKVISSSRLSVTPIHRCFLCEPLDSVCLQRVSGMGSCLTPQLFTGDFTAVTSHLTRFLSPGNGFVNGISRKWARPELSRPFELIFLLFELLKEEGKMPVATLLPFTATPNRKSASPTSFRLTEKFILLLVFSAFITLCFGAIFFLPDSSKLLSGVFFHSSAVETNTRTGPDSSDSGSAGNDERVLAKIRNDHEKALLEAKDTLQKRPDEIKQDIRNEKEKVAKESMGQGGKDVNNLPFVEYHRPPGVTGHEPLDPETRDRRAKVKEVRICWARALFVLWRKSSRQTPPRIWHFKFAFA